jgi:PII-like signaling protein
MSVFRAINGFGETGNATVSLVDLSLSLPLIIEFFDIDKDKVEKTITYLSKLVKPGHIVFWDAKTTN